MNLVDSELCPQRTGVLSCLAGVRGGEGGGEGVICTVVERSVQPVAQLRVSGNSSCWYMENVLKHCHRQGSVL